MDLSNGYESVSEEFLARRGNGKTRAIAIGVKEVRKWARTLPSGSSVIDLGCGPGFPITVVLVEEGLQVFGVDAAPSFVAAFQRNLPGTPIVCDPGLKHESRIFSKLLSAAPILLDTQVVVDGVHEWPGWAGSIVVWTDGRSCRRRGYALIRLPDAPSRKAAATSLPFEGAHIND